MKEITRFFYLITGVFIVVSCSESQTQTDENATTSINEINVEENTDQLVLNEGKKWKVNEEMMPFILESEQLVLKYNDDDYLALAEQLFELNNNLIKSCTMDGPAHDELHKWLHPHIDLLKKLKAAEDQSQSTKVIQEIKDSFVVFHAYFE
jgi:hypothetical protein